VQHPRFLGFAVAATALASSGFFAQETSGPFGLRRGMTKEQVLQIVGKDAVKEIKGDVLRLFAVPKPHRAFDEYSLIFSPNDGLLKIVAYAKDIRTNGFGEAVHDSFIEIRDAISKTYGEPAFTLDHLKDGSLWTEPQYWMMGLLKKERDLASDWNTAIPNRICAIVLDARALSTDKGYVVLTYEFEGWNEYVDAKNKKADSVF